MLLADAAANPPVEMPAEWLARSATIDGVTEVVTGPIAPVETDTDLLRQFGYDPDQIEVVGTINQWRKQLPNGDWRVSYFFKHRPRLDRLDLPALYAASRRRKALKTVETPSTGRATIVPLADLQIGKVGSRGGTPELIDRLVEKRAALDVELRRRRPDFVVLPDAGDLFENFESGGNPMFTNDLSLAQQLDMAATEVYEFVRLAARYGPVIVPVVTSNHTAWRRGKTELGRPGDDLGLFVHRQVEKVAKAAGIDARWVYPPMYDEAVTVDVLGTTLGVVHGNRFRPGKAIEWWTRQQHGGQPIGAADVLVTAHYHHLVLEPTGRNPYTSRTKWWIQLPPLDNGSDWFRNVAGEDSDPGLVIFDIAEDRGFDLRSFVVI